jgi:hypothetical protein
MKQQNKAFYLKMGALVAALVGTVIGTYFLVKNTIDGQTETVYVTNSSLAVGQELGAFMEPGEAGDSFFKTTSMAKKSIEAVYGDDVITNISYIENRTPSVYIPAGTVMRKSYLADVGTIPTSSSSTPDTSVEAADVISFPIDVKLEQVGGVQSDVSSGSYFVIYATFSGASWAGKVICQAAKIITTRGSISEGSCTAVFAIPKADFDNVSYASTQSSSLKFIYGGQTDTQCKAIAESISDANGADIVASIFASRQVSAAPVFTGKKNFGQTTLYSFETEDSTPIGFDPQWIDYSPDAVEIYQYATGGVNDNTLRVGEAVSPTNGKLFYKAKTGIYTIGNQNPDYRINYDTSTGVYSFGAGKQSGTSYLFEEPGYYVFKFIKASDQKDTNGNALPATTLYYHFLIDWGPKSKTGDKLTFSNKSKESSGTTVRYGFNGVGTTSKKAKNCYFSGNSISKVETTSTVSNLFSFVDEDASYDNFSFTRKNVSDALNDRIANGDGGLGANYAIDQTKLTDATTGGNGTASSKRFEGGDIVTWKDVSLETGHVFSSDIGNTVNVDAPASTGDVNTLCALIYRLATGHVLDNDIAAKTPFINNNLVTIDPTSTTASILADDDGIAKAVKTYDGDSIASGSNDVNAWVSDATLCGSEAKSYETRTFNVTDQTKPTDATTGGDAALLIDPVFVRNVVATYANTYSEGLEKPSDDQIYSKNSVKSNIDSLKTKLTKFWNGQVRDKGATFGTEPQNGSNVLFYRYLSSLSHKQISYLSEKIAVAVKDAANKPMPAMPVLAEIFYDKACRNYIRYNKKIISSFNAKEEFDETLAGTYFHFDSPDGELMQQCLADKTELDIYRSEAYYSDSTDITNIKAHVVKVDRKFFNSSYSDAKNGVIGSDGSFTVKSMSLSELSAMIRGAGTITAVSDDTSNVTDTVTLNDGKTNDMKIAIV